MKNLLFYFLGLLVLLTAYDALGYTAEDCIRCHKTGSGKSALQISQDEYESSVHAGEITCQDCHTGVTDHGHTATKGSGRVDCDQCHKQENRHGLRSKGGGGTSPQCHLCHTRHVIMRKEHKASSVHPDNLKQTCGSCHPAQSGEAGWLSWLTSVQIKSHSKQDFGCEYDEGDCLGCHQGEAAHGEETSLNDKGCNKCHIPQNRQAPLLGSIHPAPEFKNRPSSVIAAIVYAIAIILLLWDGFRFYIRR